MLLMMNSMDQQLDKYLMLQLNDQEQLLHQDEQMLLQAQGQLNHQQVHDPFFVDVIRSCNCPISVAKVG